jgi:hypothetical protein
MRPDPAIVLGAIAGAVAQQVPEAPTPFGQQTLGIAAGLSMMLAQDIDRAPARLVDEYRATAAILRDAAPVIGDAALSARIDDALSRDILADLQVSALQAADDAIRALLVEVHARIEATPGNTAADINERIWHELQESTRRRHLVTGI